MKFNGFVTIRKPRDIVVSYFSNPDYNHEYMDGFIKKELVSGTRGEEGAVSKMYFKYGKREMELTRDHYCQSST